MLAGVELLRLDLPLREPWVSAHGAFSAREVLLVHALADGPAGCAEGWGECAALGEPSYSEEYVESALDVMRRHLLPALFSAGVGSAWEARAAMEVVKGHRMAKSAIETAVLDAELRLAGVSLADHLGGLSRRGLTGRGPTGSAPPAPGLSVGPREPAGLSPAAPGMACPGGAGASVRRRVAAGIAVGIAPSLDHLIDAVGRHLEEGYRRVKIKIRPGWDLDPVVALRKDLGGPDRFALQVDANGSYAGVADPAASLAPLDEQGLILIEQPLADDDLLGHAALGRRLSTPICLDESIVSARSAAVALALGACRVVNIKPGRVGGYLEAVAIHDLCADEGVPVWCGGMLETGVGRAANLALAALPNFSIPGDISASSRYWWSDIVTEPAILAPDGTIAVPLGPGIGVDVIDGLAARAIASEWFSAGRVGE